MPVFSGSFADASSGVPSRSALITNGPIAPAEFHVPTQLAKLLQDKGQRVPPPQQGMVLIDTGASMSCADSAVMSKLGVKPVGQVDIGTAGGQTKASTFPARLLIGVGVIPQPLSIDFSSVVGVDLSGQSAGGQTLIGLIGRDILELCIFVYNGTTGSFSLAL